MIHYQTLADLRVCIHVYKTPLSIILTSQAEIRDVIKSKHFTPVIVLQLGQRGTHNAL